MSQFIIASLFILLSSSASFANDSISYFSQWETTLDDQGVQRVIKCKKNIYLRNSTKEIFRFTGNHIQIGLPTATGATKVTSWYGCIRPNATDLIYLDNNPRSHIQINHFRRTALYILFGRVVKYEGDYAPIMRISSDESQNRHLTNHTTLLAVKGVIRLLQRENRFGGFELTYDANGNIVARPLRKSGDLPPLLRTFSLLNRTEEPLTIQVAQRDGKKICRLNPRSWVQFELNGYYNESATIQHGNSTYFVDYSTPDALVAPNLPLTFIIDLPRLPLRGLSIPTITTDFSAMFEEGIQEQSLQAPQPLAFILKIAAQVLVMGPQGSRILKSGSTYRAQLNCGEQDWLRIYLARTSQWHLIGSKVTLDYPFLELKYINDNQVSAVYKQNPHDQGFGGEDITEQLNALLQTNRSQAISLTVRDSNSIPSI